MSPPKLFLVIVEGFLRFDDIDINLDVNYFTMRNGTFQIGSEAKPYLNRAVVTLHGSKYDKQLPAVGSKMIAVIGGWI